MVGDAGEQPADMMRGRVPGGRLRLWLLLEADRRIVTGATLVFLFVAFVVLGVVDPTPLDRAIATGDPIETLFQSLVAAIVTGVTLVVTINQLVLSQELGAVGDQRERMDAAMDFRRDIEDALGVEVSPANHAGLHRTIVEATGDRAETFREAVPDDVDGSMADRIDEFVDGLVANADEVADRLEDAQFGTFDVVLGALDFNYSWKIHQARRLRESHGDELPEEVDAALKDLLEALELYGPTREHVKTLFFQWELIDLSRGILFAALPALVVSVAAVLYLGDPGTVTGVSAGLAHVVLVASAAATVALAPFVLLLASVLRVATVAKRKLAIGPFILRGGEDGGGWPELGG